MKTWEPLRGYGVMERVYGRGRRLDTERIRCIYLLVHTTLPVVRVAFGAPSKVFGAVQRNRLKRLMREAFAREWNTLQQDLARAGISASLLFIFKGKKGERGTRFTLQAVHKSIASLCTMLRTEL